MNTIAKVLENARTGNCFYLLLGDFLDEFYNANKEVKQHMLIQPPQGDALENKPEYLSFAAATAHKLANDYKIEAPPWVFEKEYYFLKKPFFACSAKGNLRLLFMYKSPTEFKYRNLFVDENALSRI